MTASEIIMRFTKTMVLWTVAIAAGVCVAEVIENHNTEPKFHRNDKVEVVRGFWRGWTGNVLTCHRVGMLWKSWHYGIDCGVPAFVIDEDDLRKTEGP